MDHLEKKGINETTFSAISPAKMIEIGKEKWQEYEKSTHQRRLRYILWTTGEPRGTQKPRTSHVSNFMHSETQGSWARNN